MSWRPAIGALLMVVAAALPTIRTGAQGPASPSPPGAAEVQRELQSLPPSELRAMRHQQTREEDVRRLEDDHYGATQAGRARSQQKTEVDQLYEQVIKQSEQLGSAPR